MTRGILIVGNESALTAAVEAEAAARVDRYALALIPDRFSGGNPVFQPRREAPAAKTAAEFPPVSPEKARIPLEWNPGSPVSAHALVLSAENRLGRVDEAILVCDPPSVCCAAADFGPADVEILVNDHIKGWFFLVKELTAVFRARGEGTLALVFPEGNLSARRTSGPNPSGTFRRGGFETDGGPDLLGPAALAAFRSLTAGLLTAAPDEPYLTLGFSGAAAGDEAGFAAFILKSLESCTSGRQDRGSPLPEGNRRSNGKLHKYGKAGFFR